MDEKRPLGENLSADMNTGLSIPNTRGQIYEIHVQGHLSEIWADWFEGLTIEKLDNGEMVLTGTILNQAALMGILNKIHRLNLTLLWFQEVDHKT